MTLHKERVIKFKAFVDFGKLKIMLEDVNLHLTSNMIGINHESLKYLFCSTKCTVEHAGKLNAPS